MIFAVTTVSLITVLFLFQKTAPVITGLNTARAGLYWLGARAGGVVNYVFSRKAVLSEENAFLRQEISSLAHSTISADQLQEENDALRALLSYDDLDHRSRTLAKVLSREQTIAGQAILLNRGLTDGVAVGDPLIADDGVYVGSIIDARPYTSVARLVSDGESKIAVRLLNEERMIGIAEGQDGVLLKIDFIPQSVVVEIGDVVMTSGLDPGTPSGLLIGVVKSVVSDEHNPFQQAFVEPQIDLRQLTVVEIIHLEGV